MSKSEATHQAVAELNNAMDIPDIIELEHDIKVRSKKFLSYDSLRYERARLETFIEWPIEWLSPSELAADGFYYLRTKDHCACVFCRGIVGAWEVGDTPRGEHQRHFPHCPFVRRQPVGNVSIFHSNILDRLALKGEECPIPPARQEYVSDQNGSGGAQRHMPGSNPDAKAVSGTTIFDNIGLRKYSGPKRKDYITKESRKKSYVKWPERVEQNPEEMAEAGFFYCGLSDHVRCFHCGNGLRNWKSNEKPWDEHAHWYPECNFIHLSRGQEFIDKVHSEKPPDELVVSSGQFNPISESDLEHLMNLDIMQAVSGMNFPSKITRKVLYLKLQQTGLPFFSLEPCIEAILQLWEKDVENKLKTEVRGDEPIPTSCSSSGPIDSATPVVSLETEPVVEDMEIQTENVLVHEERQEQTLKKSPLSETAKTSTGDDTAAELERMRDSRTCKICMNAEINMLFLPCMHMATCSDCAVTMTICPFCRMDIKYTIKPILS